MPKKYVIGDIHGQHKALVQTLQRCNFDYEEDLLIVLGDIVDGGPDTFKVVEELLKITNIVVLLGNHDLWFKRFLDGGITYDSDSYSTYQTWYQQGGKETLDSYSLAGYKEGVVPITHQELFNSMVPYFVHENKLFVHGGYEPSLPIEQHNPYFLIWDRDLLHKSKTNIQLSYDKVFVGHTDIGTTPIFYPNGLIALDTGAGWKGKLTVMDIDTLEYWQSDLVENGR